MNKKVKTAIYVCIVLWMAAFAQMGTTWLTFSGSSITQAFTRNQLVIDKSVIEAKIYLGDKTLDEVRIKKEFGEKTEVTIVSKGGLRYGHIRIEDQANLDELVDRRSKLQSELAKTKQKDLIVTAYVEGHTNHRTSEEEKKKLSSSLLKHLGSLQISEHKGQQFYTIYGFTTGLSDTIAVNGKHINVNIAMTEDEEKKQTKVFLGIPMIDMEY